MPVVEVYVVGVNSAMTGLMVESEYISKKALARLYGVASSVAATARGLMSTHSLSGATVSAIKVSEPKVISKYLDETSKGLFAQELTAPTWMRQMRDPSTGRFMTYNPLLVTVPKLVTVLVGIDHNNVPPFFVGSTFEFGWHSDRGLRPPTQPLAEWALRRGLTTNPKEAQHVGYLVSKKIGERGYKFGELHWLSDAWAMHKEAAASVTSGFIR